VAKRHHDLPPGGRNAYLIGFMDDYSRYITALGLYRSQTAAHVLETYRRGIAEYGVPKEMLTDNGRQYTNWRGKTRFEREMKKDRVKHIRSRPHHPMTLGKIERFWKSILGSFSSGPSSTASSRRGANCLLGQVLQLQATAPGHRGTYVRPIGSSRSPTT
jgi:transposase InsO family protein